MTTTIGSSSKNAAILISMLSTAYMAHYNAPKFYWELHTSSSNNTAVKNDGATISSSTTNIYRNVVFQSYSIAIGLMIIIASMGYLTFGNHCQSVILNNYSSKDTFMSLSRWAIVISLIFSYPLAFVGVRDGIYNLFHIDRHAYRYTNQITTIVLLSIITFIASVMKDIRIILSLGGATFGNLLSYVFPSLMVIGLANKQTKNANMIIPATTIKSKSTTITTSKDDKPFPSPNQVRFSILTAILGVAMGIIGTTKAIQSM
jgi:Transmembrane amino acid transporter protein